MVCELLHRALFRFRRWRPPPLPWISLLSFMRSGIHRPRRRSILRPNARWRLGWSWWRMTRCSCIRRRRTWRRNLQLLRWRSRWHTLSSGFVGRAGLASLTPLRNRTGLLPSLRICFRCHRPRPCDGIFISLRLRYSLRLCLAPSSYKSFTRLRLRACQRLRRRKRGSRATGRGPLSLLSPRLLSLIHI